MDLFLLNYLVFSYFMHAAKADIIATLQKELQSLQGIRPALDNAALNDKLGPIKNAFPNRSFPLGAVHELLSRTAEEKASGAGFLAAVVSSLMQKNGVSIWISLNKQWFPPAFQNFGIAPDKIIFINPAKEKELAWITEEALNCESVCAVVSEMKDMSFTTSRRLQLAVEKSKTTGFIIRTDPRQVQATASMARWRISSLPGIVPNDLPGVGFFSWNVELLKARNARPTSWQVEFSQGRFKELKKIAAIHAIQQKKTG